MFTITVRDDAPVTKRVIIHDEDGNELGDLAIDQTAVGVRVNAYERATDQIVGTLVIRR